MSEEMTRKEVIWQLKGLLLGELRTTTKERKALEYAISSLETDEAYQLEYERTTKNDLGVDAVSRKAVHDMLENLPITVEDKWFNWLQKACMRLAELTSVTPQESRWIPVSERLPKIAGIYRVTRYYPNNVINPNYLVDACFFDGSNTWYNDNRINHERAYVDNIIAWQENPEPYEPQESEDKE